MNKEEKIVIGAIMSLIVVIMTAFIIDVRTYDKEHFSESVTATVMNEAEMQKFDVPSAMMGYVLGQSMGSGMGLPMGGMTGMAGASGCEIPVIIQGEPVILKESSTVKCKSIEPGKDVKVYRRYFIKTHKGTGEQTRHNRKFKLQ